MVSLLLPALLWLATAPPAPAAPRLVPSPGREPVIDGQLADLAPALQVPVPADARGPSVALAVQVAFRQDTLYLGVRVDDAHLRPDDHLDVLLSFRDAGATARGVVYRFNVGGSVAPSPEGEAEPWAQALVRAATRGDARGYWLEAAIPARALPRFPAFAPLLLDLCLEYSDADAQGGAPSLVRTCPGGEPTGGPVRLPDAWRRALGAAPDVQGLEAHPKGWLGFSRLHDPVWARSDEPLTAASLAALLAGEDAVTVQAAGLRLPEALTLPDGRVLLTVLTGRSPFGPGGGCQGSAELRLSLYLVQGLTASRALAWPAAACRLGRAIRLELTDEGSLVVGYTGGALAHFTFIRDHFERSELGLRDL
jgi:hypothetical protein